MDSFIEMGLGTFLIGGGLVVLPAMLGSLVLIFKAAIERDKTSLREIRPLFRKALKPLAIVALASVGVGSYAAWYNSDPEGRDKMFQDLALGAYNSIAAFFEDTVFVCELSSPSGTAVLLADKPGDERWAETVNGELIRADLIVACKEVPVDSTGKITD